MRLDATVDSDAAFREFRVKLGDLLLFLILSEGRAGFHPNRGFVAEWKDANERGWSFRMTDEVERQIAESIWPDMDHMHLQGLALEFYAPPGPVQCPVCWIAGKPRVQLSSMLGQPLGGLEDSYAKKFDLGRECRKGSMTLELSWGVPIQLCSWAMFYMK